MMFQTLAYLMLVFCFVYAVLDTIRVLRSWWRRHQILRNATSLTVSNESLGITRGMIIEIDTDKHLVTLRKMPQDAGGER